MTEAMQAPLSTKQLTEDESALRGLRTEDSYLEKYGFHFSDENYTFRSRPGIDAEIVAEISHIKGEPAWMTEFRLKSYETFMAKPMPTWGGDMSGIKFDEIFYYVRATDTDTANWDEVPADIKETFDRLGIPEAEQKFLSGSGAQIESEMVYHKIQKELEDLGVLFLSMDEGLRQHPDLVKEYFGTIIPYTDNKFAALNSAVWSGGSFIYVPKGVHIKMPLQAYFRINSESMGQFERTLIIVDEGASVHYIEGCTAPVYSKNSLHSAVVEIVVKKGGRCRYTTIQNWSNNVYNLVTKRAVAYADATMEWVDANLGCLAEGSTVTTPDGIKTIETLNVGDRVLSYDEQAGRLDFRKVLAKRYSGEQPVHTVSVGERQLQATANHPFYSMVYDVQLEEYRPAYVRVDHLENAIVPAMALELAGVGGQAFTGNSNFELSEDVELVAVEVSEATSELVPTWDIEVEGTGNFVSQGFIVHNSHLTMKYPAVHMMEPGAHGEILSIAFAGRGQHQDAGGKVVHHAPNTTSRIISKSISKDGGRASYRGLLRVDEGATGVRSNVVCDALLLDPASRSDTYPYIEVDEQDVTIGHEASVSKIGEEQIFYLMSRGLSEDQANAMIVNGFIEPLARELPMEYSIELRKLIEIQLEGTIG
jgi:Fe-S cluster assembly scaffold protein SufB